jgi:hypothetical protein
MLIKCLVTTGYIKPRRDEKRYPIVCNISIPSQYFELHLNRAHSIKAKGTIKMYQDKGMV